MSLEEALNRNNELLTEHNDLLKQVIGAAGLKSSSTKTADADDGETKATTKRGRKPAKKDDDAEAGVTFEGLKSKLSAWLSEFKESENDPETDARKAALAGAFKKLGVGKLPEMEDDDDKIARLHTWLEEKAKVVDKGHGKGRFTEKPSDEDAGSDDEDDDLDV